MRRKRLLGAFLAVLLVVVLVCVGVLRGCRQEGGMTPPAPAAPKAPQWTSDQPRPSGQDAPPDKPPEEPPWDPHAKYGWPADFELPLNIVIEDIPEVPERIKGPSQPDDRTREQNRGADAPFG